MDGAREGPARASPLGRSRSRSRSRRRLAMTSGRPEPSLPAMTDDDRNALAAVSYTHLTLPTILLV